MSDVLPIAAPSQARSPIADVRTFGVRPNGVECRLRSAAYAVVTDAHGRVAFVRGRSHIWLVGGGSENDESPEQTVRREVREEAGCELVIHGLIGVARQYFQVDDVQYDMHATFFSASFGANIGDPEETIEWLDPDEVASEIFHDSHIWAIAQHRDVVRETSAS